MIKVRFPSGTLKKKHEPQNTFLKSPDARMQLPGRPLGRVEEPLDVINNVQQNYNSYQEYLYTYTKDHTGVSRWRKG